MGRQSSDLIPFLREALMNETYANLRYESKEEGVFFVTLPRKTVSNTKWESPLKDWDKLKGRVYTDYSTSKQVFISALRRSPYLKDLKKHSKSAMFFQFQTSEEVKAKREAQKLGKISSIGGSSDSEDIMNPLSNASSGYVSEDQPEVLMTDPFEITLNDLADSESLDSFPNDLSLLEEEHENLPSCDAVIESVFQECGQMDVVPEFDNNLCVKSLSNNSYADGNHSQDVENTEIKHGNIIENRSKWWICKSYIQVEEYLQVICEPLEFSSDIQMSSGVLFPDAILEITRNLILIQDFCLDNYKVLIYKPRDI